ncbi:MAG: PD-(D/E)XK nuclease family protein [Bacteroidales bacterium]|nr:PD-(D/E)XK nuclease family protein [Bacteroidales bacterium]
MDQITTIAKNVYEDCLKQIFPYNTFLKWNMSENDHTKLLLALLRYQDSNGHFPVLYSFLKRFTKGRGSRGYQAYNKNATHVDIQFSPRYSEKTVNEKNLSFVDGIIFIEPKEEEERIAIIIENKIYDAIDQPDQIRRYIRLMNKKEKIKEYNIWALYITGDGSKEIDKKISYDPEGTKEEINIGRRFVPLNYSDDILNWLKEDILKPDIKHIYPETLTSIVRVYADYLENELTARGGRDFEKYKLVLFKELKKTGKISSDKLDIETNNNKLKDDLVALYKLFDEIKGQKDRREDDNPNESDQGNPNVFLYRLLKRILKNIEYQVFDNFEKTSANLLNQKWKKKKVSWKVVHRGNMGNCRGFIQLRLTDDWESAHLEWCKMSTLKMLFKTEYILELHVEGKGENRNQIRTEFRKELCNVNSSSFDSSDNSPYVLEERKRNAPAQFIIGFNIRTKKPIKQMSQEELEDFLKDLYYNKLKRICELLVEKKNAYNNIETSTTELEDTVD